MSKKQLPKKCSNQQCGAPAKWVLIAEIPVDGQEVNCQLEEAMFTCQPHLREAKLQLIMHAKKHKETTETWLEAKRPGVKDKLLWNSLRIASHLVDTPMGQELLAVYRRSKGN